MVGVGIIGLPLGLRQSGWYGLFVLVAVWLMTTYTGVVLGKPFNEDPSLVTYDDLGNKCFPKWGKIFTAICQIATLTGVAIIFIIIAGLFLRALLIDQVPHVNNLMWSVICAAVLLPFCYLRTLEETWWIALLGVLTSGIAIVCILVGDFMKGKEPNVSYGDVDFVSFMRSFARFAFAFGGHPVFPSIQRVMKRRSRFQWAVIVSFGVAFTLFSLIAVTSYAMFGEKTSSNIFDNFGRSVPAIIGMVALILHLLFAFVIILNPVFIHIEKSIGLGLEVDIFVRSKKKHTTVDKLTINSHSTIDKDPNVVDFETMLTTEVKSATKLSSEPSKPHFHPFAKVLPKPLKSYAPVILYFLVRTSMVAFVAFISVLIPFFTDLMDLIGGTTITLTSFILPVLFYWKLNYRTMKLWEVLFSICIIVFALFAGTSASVFAIKKIIEDSGQYGVFVGH